MILFEAMPCAFCSGRYTAAYDAPSANETRDPWTVTHETPACPPAIHLAPRVFIRETHAERRKGDGPGRRGGASRPV